MDYESLLITHLPFTIAFRPAAPSILKYLLRSVSVRSTSHRKPSYISVIQ